VNERSAVLHVYQFGRGDSIILSCETRLLVSLHINLISEMSLLDYLRICVFLLSLLISKEKEFQIERKQTGPTIAVHSKTHNPQGKADIESVDLSEGSQFMY
jgi:hypothetical protein